MQLDFDNKNYNELLSILKESSGLWEELSGIKFLKKVDLKSCGNNNDLDNFQVFTPEFIVNDMIKAVGVDNVANNDYNILEPSSGDGAFTCRILQLRLKKNVKKDTENVFEALLKCLSTIYSIELDRNLVDEQRNNIYTISMKFLEKRKVSLTEAEDAALRLLIYSNFIWGETNIYQPPTFLICDVAYKMPEASKNRYESLSFPVWCFSNNKVSLHYEAPEVGY